MTKIEWSHFREPAAPPQQPSLPSMVGFEYYGLLFGCVTAVAGTTEHWKNRTLIPIDRHRSQCETSFMMVNVILSSQTTLDPPETRTDQRYF